MLILIITKIFKYNKEAYRSFIFSNSNKVDHTTNLINLYEQDQNICVQCRGIFTSDTIHCLACNVCVTDWDHHCFWLDVCIKSSNQMLFYIFLGVVSLSLLSNFALFGWISVGCITEIVIKPDMFENVFIFYILEIVYTILFCVLLGFCLFLIV